MKKNDTVIVTVKNGIHPYIKYPIREIRTFLKGFFEKAGIAGMFQVTLGARKRGRNHMRKVSVIKENGSSVKLKVKPGGSDTCCEVYVIVPKEWSGRAVDLLKILRECAPQMD
jgi:hypothetical protein